MGQNINCRNLIGDSSHLLRIKNLILDKEIEKKQKKTLGCNVERKLKSFYSYFHGVVTEMFLIT